MNKVCHYIITHFDKEGNYYLNENLMKVAKKNPESFILVINNISRVLPGKVSEILNSYTGIEKLTYDIESISILRNTIIKEFLNTEFNFMTMIDGDDDISNDYHESLIQFSNSVELFGIFNGEWVYPDKSFIGIFHPCSDKLLKYAQHYTNWLYIYSKNFLKSDFSRYPDIKGYDFPEDEYFYSLLASYASDHNYIVPVFNRILYRYLEGNSKVAKMDTSINKQLAEYLGNRKMLRYELIN